MRPPTAVAAPPPTPLRPLATLGGSRSSLRLFFCTAIKTLRPAHPPLCAVLGWGWGPPSPACGCAAGACRSPLRTRRGVFNTLAAVVAVPSSVFGWLSALWPCVLFAPFGRVALVGLLGPVCCRARHSARSLRRSPCGRHIGCRCRSPFFSACARCCVLAFLGFPLSRRLARFAPKKASPSDRPQETFFIGYRTDVTQTKQMAIK